MFFGCEMDDHHPWWHSDDEADGGHYYPTYVRVLYMHHTISYPYTPYMNGWVFAVMIFELVWPSKGGGGGRPTVSSLQSTSSRVPAIPLLASPPSENVMAAWL